MFILKCCVCPMPFSINTMRFNLKNCWEILLHILKGLSSDSADLHCPGSFLWVWALTQLTLSNIVDRFCCASLRDSQATRLICIALAGKLPVSSTSDTQLFHDRTHLLTPKLIEAHLTLNETHSKLKVSNKYQQHTVDCVSAVQGLRASSMVLQPRPFAGGIRTEDRQCLLQTRSSILPLAWFWVRILNLLLHQLPVLKKIKWTRLSKTELLLKNVLVRM